MSAVLSYARSKPIPNTVVYQDFPAGMHSWRIEGAIHLAYGLETRVLDRASPEAQQRAAGTYVPESRSIVLESPE